MAKERPIVSIIIPTRNSAETLNKCLRAINDQTYNAIELIVVDNYSTDETMSIAMTHCEKVFEQDGGMANQVNRGAKEAEGDCIAYFDDDMYLGKDVIIDCVAKYQAGADGIIIPEQTLQNSFWATVRDVEKSFYAGDMTIEASRFFDSNVFKALDGMNEELLGYRDFDLHRRFIENGYRVEYIHSPLYHESEPKLLSIFMKRYQRGQSFIRYFMEHPKHTTEIVFRKPLLIGIIQTLMTNPKIGIGLVVLKFVEYVASALGVVVEKLRNVGARLESSSRALDESHRNR